MTQSVPVQSEQLQLSELDLFLIYCSTKHKTICAAPKLCIATLLKSYSYHLAGYVQTTGQLTSRGSYNTN